MFGLRIDFQREVRAILCAIYTRLSKEDEDKQRSESESIQNQKSLLLHYAEERGWEVYQMYCDEDYSGADSLRPDFNRMLRDARQKKFQIILCKTQSRFTRDMELVEKYIHNLFPLWGIRFIAVADNADTEIKGNKKARQINGLVNEWYLEDLSENVRMVLDMKRREGKYIGGSPLYGYKKDPRDKNRIVIDWPAATVVRQIFRWSLEGQGRQRIARTLNEQGVPSPARYKAEQAGAPLAEGSLWNKIAVWRILRNEMYTGVMIQGRRKKASYKSRQLIDMPEEAWYRVEGTHEAIIDPETFQAVQRGLETRARSDGRGEAHVLSGLVRCMDCGSAMTKTVNGSGGTSYLRCSRYAEGMRGCTRHSVRLDRLTELVTERVRAYIRMWYTPEKLEPEPRRDARHEALERERKALEAMLEKRSQALKSLYLDKVSGILSPEQFVELSQAFQAEKGSLEGRLVRIERELSAAESPRRQEALLERANKLLALETLPRELAVQLIKKVEVGERSPDSGEQAVHIVWKF